MNPRGGDRRSEQYLAHFHGQRNREMMARMSWWDIVTLLVHHLQARERIRNAIRADAFAFSDEEDD